jgi:glycosyltransferase involved in cell wall biosynthesis
MYLGASIVLFLKGTCLGGAELNALRILECLKQKGFRTRLITSSRGELFNRFVSATEDQLVVAFPFPRNPLSWLTLASFWLKVRKFLDQSSESQVLFSGDFYTLWAVLLFRSASRPVLSLWQGEYRFRDDSCVRKWLVYGAGRADRLFASGPVAAHANGTRLLPTLVQTLNPHIDDRRFNPSLYSRSESRRFFGWKETDHVAVCVGRIGVGKGQVWLAGRFVQDVRFPQNAKLVIVGPGSEEDFRILRSFEAQSAGRLVVFGSRDDIPEILAAADVAIQAGDLQESFGLAAIEACLMQIPLIAFNVGALSSILGTDYPGLFNLSERDEFIEKWINSSGNQSAVWGKDIRLYLLSMYAGRAWIKQLENALAGLT